ncbi:MAG: hypothetical protein ABFD66_13220 [Smithella sp.]
MKRLLLLLACSVFFSGCALTRDQVTLNYNMNIPLAQSFLDQPQEAVSIGTIMDRRGTDDPRLIFNKKNLYGDTMGGGWLAEKPVASIVEDTVREALSKANYNIAPAAEYQLYGTLQELRYEMIMGFWEGELRTVMAVQLHLKDMRSGRVVWNETFMGRSSLKGQFFGVDVVRTALTGVLNDLAKQIGESDGLRSNFVPAISRTPVSSMIVK